MSADNIWYFALFYTSQGNDYAGYISNGVDDMTQLATNFTYGEFEQQHSAKLFAAKSDDEFNKNWDEIIKYYNDKMKYADAKKEMETVFKMRGFEVAAN